MKKIKKKQSKALISNIIFSLIALFSLTVCIILLLYNYNLKERAQKAESETERIQEYAKEHCYTQADMDENTEKIREEENAKEKNILLDEIKEIMNNGYSAYYLLRGLYPDDVVVTYNNGYEFYPINDSLKKNDYELSNFIQDEETGEIVYQDDSKGQISKKGIDVSSHNGDIDWDKVKKDGIEFAYIRVGYRGSSEGAISIDSKFEDNIKGANKAGIDVGVYFYTQAVNTQEAVEEAEFVLDTIEPYTVTYPIAYDIELLKDGRADSLSKDEYIACTEAFCERIKNEDLTPMVYGNLNSFFNMLSPEALNNYEKWFAYYSYPVYNPYDYAIWQYSAEGHVDGIKGDVDMNICLKTIHND